jgi:beta-N-acetylhexosaminidase
LIVTFLLGIGIGYSLHYAQVEISGPPPGSGSTVATQTDATKPEGEPAAPPATSADIEDLWPARHLFIGIEGTTLDDATRDLIREYKPGGIVLREQNLADEAQALALVREIKEAAGQGLGVSALPLIAVAQESGAANPLKIEALPTAADIGADERGARQAARQIAAAARAREIAVVFAPVLEVAPATLQGPERLRFFSTDPATVAEVGIAFADGLLEGGALPVVKRYPGFGTAAGGAGITVLEERDTGQLARLMYPFSEAAEAELPGILVGHVMVPALDTVSPASLSAGLVSKIIRDSWRYNGVVIADDITVTETIADRKPEEAAAEALIAGCDAVVALNIDRALLEHITAGVLDVVNVGLLSRESLQASKTRLDAWRDRIQALPVRIEPPAAEGTPLVLDAPVPEAPPAADAEVPEVPAAPDDAAAPEEPAPAPVVDAPAPDQPTESGDAPVTDMPAPEAPEVAAPDEKAPEAPAETPALAPAVDTAEEEPAKAATDDAESKAPAVGKRASMQPPNTRRLRHRIEKGDTLTSIATKYATSVDKIKAWNSLEDNDIKWGYTLTVYVPEEEKPAPPPAAPAEPAPSEEPAAATPADPAVAPAPEASAEEPPAVIAPAMEDAMSMNTAPAPPPITPVEPEPAPVSDPEPEPVIDPAPTPAAAAGDVPTAVRQHRLGPDETLDDVANDFGVTKEQIMEWNGLLVDTPEPGYQLKIHLPVAVEE